ncbi:hypothetical protein [Klenkia brasiliensis]|uniref:DnaJ domain-containing protein n=1 Tax=Klenkia brasiliensis TaxID=333142 RepID=A0A1G7YH41_9ACTN|nr:hypothetical protein [Klenkia brasiliensis]SDG95912.1 hypothetical protein SAMN05660324_3961 [Klenkia brasiliensis]
MSAFEWTVRPLPAWPHPSTERRRGPYTFRASWDDTLRDLAAEVALLGGDEVVLGVVCDPADLTLRGRLRANATPRHPGVVMEVATDGDVLVFASDVCERWTHNVRSISLGLEALRAVDRHGIGQARQQYRGFAKAIAGPAPRDAARVLRDLSGRDVVASSDPAVLRSAYRAALVRWHPDSPDGHRPTFDQLQSAAEALGLRS